MKGSKYCKLLIGVMIIIFIPYLGATTFRATTFQKMIEESDLVVEGTCVEKSSRFVGNIIMTVADIEVHSVLKGQEGRKEKGNDNIQIAYVGGEVESPLPLGQKVHGGVNLEIGDRAYLFLNVPDRRNRYYSAAREEFELKDYPLEVKSMARGVFKVRDEQLVFNRWQEPFKRELFDKYAPESLRLQQKDENVPQKGWIVQPEVFSQAVMNQPQAEEE